MIVITVQVFGRTFYVLLRERSPDHTEERFASVQGGSATIRRCLTLVVLFLRLFQIYIEEEHERGNKIQAVLSSADRSS